MGVSNIWVRSEDKNWVFKHQTAFETRNVVFYSPTSSTIGKCSISSRNATMKTKIERQVPYFLVKKSEVLIQSWSLDNVDNLFRPFGKKWLKNFRRMDNADNFLGFRITWLINWSQMVNVDSRNTDKPFRPRQVDNDFPSNGWRG